MKNRNKEKDLSGNLEFQIIDWFIPNIKQQFYRNEYSRNHYDINMYGTTANQESVMCIVEGFKPYFYVRAPLDLTKEQVKKRVETLQERLEDGSYKYRVRKFRSEETEERIGLSEKDYNNLQIKVVRKKDFWGYSDKKRIFLKVITGTSNLFRNMQSIIETFDQKDGGNRWILYEANMQPFIRFIHELEIKPSGWLSVDLDNVREIEDETNCNYSFITSVDQIEPVKINTISPMLIASFDIECTSSHGDFPMAIKDYKRLAQDFCENADDLIGECLITIIKTCYEKDVYVDGKKINMLHAKSMPTPRQIKNMTAHIEEIEECLDKVANQKGMKQHEIQEIEARINSLLTKNLPPLYGDPIIQIGTTFHVYGSDEIVYKHLVNLGTCDNIDGIDVVCCSTEDELLMRWKEMILDKNPDVLSGYNIMGFDFKYMYDRCLELKCLDNFIEGFGKSSNIDADYETKTRSSSAMGEVNTYCFKFEGIMIIDMMIYVKSPGVLTLDSYKLDNVAEHILGDKKVDLKANDIFKKYLGTSADRAEIGVYCIQDCALVNRLIQKMRVIENNMGMSNVCLVPMSYIFHRGQGIKIHSLVMYECSKRGQVIPCREYYDDGGYEGAIVLNPKTGIYVEDPIVVFDYSSLYPSSMIAENLSHDSYIKPEEVCQYVSNGELISNKDDNLVLNIIEVDGVNHHYVKYKDGTKSTVPQILEMLIKQRKLTRSKIGYQTLTLSNGNELSGIYNEAQNTIKDLDTGETIQISDEVVSTKDTYNDFEKAVFDSLQLAYKITANSLYGQTGAKTSPIYLKSIAECTTATGRQMIIKAKKFVENNYNADVIYGDTDSIFCKFPLKNKGKDAVPEAIQIGLEVEKEIAKVMKVHKPQALNYEKVLYPFILFSKKRYVGLLYETDPNKCKEKSMGIALKRRDYSKIMKDVYGAVIHKILWDNDLKGSFDELDKRLTKLVNGEVELESLIISKTLKSTYKDPEKIAHKVLADRMGARDPGNKPQINDRLPYIYIETGNKKSLQGDRIEHPDFVKANPNIKPDYGHYIKNQIMNPVVQLYSLCVEQIPGYNYPPNYWELQDEKLKEKELYMDNTKRANRIEALKEQTVQKFLFDAHLRALETISQDPENENKRTCGNKRTIVQIDHKCKKDELENIECDVVVKSITKSKSMLISINGEKTEIALKKDDIHNKATHTVEQLLKFMDKNNDKYVTFKVKGLAKLVKDFQDIKQIYTDETRSWIDVNTSACVLFGGKISNYFHRINIIASK